MHVSIEVSHIQICNVFNCTVKVTKCVSLYRVVQKTCVSLPLIAFLVGLFEKTLPKLRERIQDIDL